MRGHSQIKYKGEWVMEWGMDNSIVFLGGREWMEEFLRNNLRSNMEEEDKKESTNEGQLQNQNWRRGSGSESERPLK